MAVFSLIRIFVLAVLWLMLFTIVFEVLGNLLVGSTNRFNRPFVAEKRDVQTDFDVEYKFLDNGFRDYGLRADCEPWQMKILVVGDSAAFGQGLDSHETFTNLLADSGWCVENLSMIGKDISYYLRSISEAKHVSYHHVVILMHQNDTSLSYSQSLWDELKFLALTHSYLVNFVRVSLNFVNGFIREVRPPVLIAGRYNNPATVISVDPNFLIKWYRDVGNDNVWINRFRLLLERASRKGPVSVGVVPEVGRCSKEHREFYERLGANVRVGFESDLIEVVRQECRLTMGCAYRDVFTKICDAEHARDIFFSNDFHMKYEGQLILLEEFVKNQ